MARLMPNVNKFFQQGGITTKMRTTQSTRSSVAGWVAIFHGASSVQYGCDDNGCNGMPRVDPFDRSFVRILEEDYDYDTYVFSEDLKTFEDVLERDEDIHSHSGIPCTSELFKKVMYFAENEQSCTPNTNETCRSTIVVHINCLDLIGESDGYGLETYAGRVNCLDKEITSMALALWNHVPNTTTFMFTVNHGGMGYSHSRFNLETINVPFAMWGYGVKKHAPLLGKPALTLQVAPSLFTALDITESIPKTWLEIPLSDIYTRTEGQYARYDNLASITFESLDLEACDSVILVKHSHVKNFYVVLRVIGTLMILLFAVTMP